MGRINIGHGKLNASLTRYEGGFQRASKAVVILTRIALIFLIFMLVIDVFLRFALNSPLPASVEIGRVIMPYIVFIPFAYTLYTGQHIQITILTDRLPSKGRAWCERLDYMVGFVISALLTYWGWLHFWESFVIREEILAAIYVPWWVGKFAMPIGMALFTIAFLIRLVVSFGSAVRK